MEKARLAFVNPPMARDCDTCLVLRRTTTIQVPADLKALIRRTRQMVARGVLKPVRSDWFGQRWDKLPDKPPWPDHIEYHFACSNCGARFRLAAETHHGSGGSWGLE